MFTYRARRIGTTTFAAMLSIAVLSACVQAGDETTTPEISPSVAAPASSPAPVVRKLGPAGYGELRLGQSEAEAMATGVITKVVGDAAEGQGCWRQAHLPGSPSTGPDELPGLALFSDKLGLAAIYAYPGVETPEGVTVGTTVDEVRRIYPSWKIVSDEGTQDGRGYADVPGGQAVYRIVTEDGKVSQLALQLKNQDCYE